MLPELRRRLAALRRRAYRFERREVRQFRRWIETTSNLTRVSVLLFVPLLVGLVTLLANSVALVSFLLFPPLASGTYTLFSEPEGRYSDPRKFVGGMTVGALCGWGAVEFTATYVYGVPTSALGVDAGAAAVGVLLTGVVTWLLHLELPTAYSTALLVLITGAAQLAYVVGVALSATLVAIVFVVWRGQVYEQRARYLYRTTNADDHVIVPMRGETASQTAMFGARIAAAHDAGKVVLLDVVEDEDLAEAERALSGATRRTPSTSRTRRRTSRRRPPTRPRGNSNSRRRASRRGSASPATWSSRWPTATRHRPSSRPPRRRTPTSS